MSATTDGLRGRLYDACARRRKGEGAEPLQELLRQLSDADLRQAALWFHENLCAAPDDPVNVWAARQLADRPLGWPPEQAAELLGRVAGAEAPVDPLTLLQHFAELVRLPLAAAAEAGSYDRERLRSLRRQLPAAWGTVAPEIRERLDALIGPEPPADGTGLPAELLDAYDDFGPAMRAAHRELLASPGAAAFLAHCATQGKVRATKRWRREAAALLADAERGEEIVRALLDGMAAQREHPVTELSPVWGEGRAPGIASEANETLVRGLVWAAADLGGEWVVPAVGAVALNAATGLGGSGGTCRNGRIATSAVGVLGEFGGAQGAQAVRALGLLKGPVRNRTVVKGIAKSLEAVAERSGLTPSMIRERAVPSFGLDARGIRDEPLGAYTAALSISAPGAASLGFRGPQGRVLRSAPKSVRDEHGQELAGMREALKQLQALLPVERGRLEEHLMAGTRWAGADWEPYYIDHPVTGSLARALVWEISTDDGVGWTAGLPERTGGGWALAGADGTAVPVAGGSSLRLWHPVRASSDDAGEWRAELVGRELRQPFPQVFREVHRLAPAERASRTHSERFAGHILRYPRARALMVERGWAGPQLGYFSEGREARMERELPRPGELHPSDGEFWRAGLTVALVDQQQSDGGLAALCSTGRLSFERRRGLRGAWEPAELADVPERAGSEAMRDVGLFIGAASIGADPQWQERGEDLDRDRGEERDWDRAYDAYWQDWAFGELTESARVRRAALALLLPRTRIADRVELTERWLRVRGELRTYRIHLGSGNILLEPDDTHLRIVADPTPDREAVFLPFEEDGGLLSQILSKAFLLADDDRIADRTITGPVRRD
ncbi:MAG TPA: DUF4132 domain-containing protein [Streptomyces sp.]|nr:DUF4132 domain-containing protein [Streptomyces sp.]